MNTEATIARVLAVIGLAAAIITVGMLARSSGVFGGSPDQVLTTATTSPAAAQTPTTSTGSFSAMDSSGSASGSDASTSSASVSSGDTTATTTTAGNTYVVQNGDTFYSVAHKFNTTIANIQKLNPGIDPQNLKPGVTISVPAS